MTYHYGNDIPGFFFDIMNQPIFSGGNLYMNQGGSSLVIRSFLEDYPAWSTFKKHDGKWRF